MRHKLLLGAHMSIAGGIHNAFGHGMKAGCRTLQIFLKNNSQWRARKLTDDDRELYWKARQSAGIEPVVAHSSYLINMASPEPDLWEQSIQALIDELERASFLEIRYLVIHPGAHMGSGEDQGIARIAAALDRALDTVAPPVRILLESTAGQGTSIGHRFEHLAAILDRVRQSSRIAFCLDTCHLFAAGYDISTADGYGRVMSRFRRLIGIERICAFHVNDSLRELGSRVDRHSHIGKGRIGLEAFRCLVNDRRFARIPKILETPKGKDLAEDVMNLAVLRSLAGS